MTAYKNIIERSPFPMAATEGPAHLLLAMNSAFCAILGKEARELLGRPIAEAIPQSIADSILGLLDRVYLSAESGTVNSERFSGPERRLVCQTYTAWAIPPSGEIAAGLVIQVMDSSEATLADKRSELAYDEMREINQKLLISGIRQHELAEIAAQTEQRNEQTNDAMREANSQLVITGVKQRESAKVAALAHKVMSRAFDRERAIATALQYFVLWQEPEDIFPGLAMGTIYEPALEEALVGGDFFDAFSLPSGQVMLVVGDVTGKGLKAAARTVEVKYVLRGLAQDCEAPADVAARLNDYICRHHGEIDWENELIVLLLAVINPVDGSVRVISAGAERPFIVRATGAIEEIPTSGMMLGANPGITYTQLDRSLEPGDVMVLTTDGITEARHGLEFFGSNGIAEIVRQADPSMSMLDIGMAVVDTARDFGGGGFKDDVCILLLRRK